MLDEIGAKENAVPAALKNKRTIAIAVIVAILAVAGAAFAYFSSTGSGTATATVGTSQALTVNGTTSGALYPGGSTAVSFTAANPSSGHEYLSTIHLASVSVDSAHSTCTTSWFSMPDVSASQDIPSGTGANATAVTATGTLSMSNTGNQDACQGATLTLNFTTS